MDYCFWSFPQPSPLRYNDPDTTCRTVLNHNRDMSVDWEYEDVNRNNNRGLCILSDDPDRQCARSWDPADPKLNRGNTNMQRVRKVPI